MKKTTYSQIIIAYLKTHKQFIPALRANSWLEVRGTKHWIGISIDRMCRKLAEKKILDKHWELISKPDGDRSYMAFSLNKKIKKRLK